MIIKRLYLHHFRNYTQEEVTFSPGVNWIVGNNAQGKTNLLEALYLLSTGRSFRTSQLSQLIQHGASFFFLEAEIEKEGVSQTLKLSFDGEAKKVQFNASTYSHFTPLLGLLPHVLYAPEDISLVAGAPALRRKFLDVHLSQLDPLYLHHLARYHKAMRQRNDLLKKKSEEAIEPWEQVMALSGAYLIQKRAKLIEELQPPLLKHLQALSANKDTLRLAYALSLPLKPAEALYEGWKKSRKKELHVGVTLSGPHRDDLDFLIEGYTAKAMASEGQKHTILAALHLCEWDHFREHTGEKPLFTVDDFGGHLDQERQKHFQSQVAQLGQIFLSSPKALPDIFPDKKIVEIGSGQVLEESRA